MIRTVLPWPLEIGLKKGRTQNCGGGCICSRPVTHLQCMGVRWTRKWVLIMTGFNHGSVGSLSNSFEDFITLDSLIMDWLLENKASPIFKMLSTNLPVGLDQPKRNWKELIMTNES